MSVRATELPKAYHQAVERWRDTYLPDFGLLVERWDQFFPKDRPFRLCAYRECGPCGKIECGERKGEEKFVQVGEMGPDQATHLLSAVRAQASTEFGSIQQHQLTLSRAQDEQDQFWILRMMAEELRHGYQMLHLLLNDDWSKATSRSGADMVEEILSMRTGSHILGTFNVDFDSFVDNIVFCALIDRVGKYQLSMQKVSAYRPMAESMPEMLREEAFHLAAGVLPLRRWAEQAAQDSVYVSMPLMQKVINKWLPRGLEMFGHEKGGATNVRYGFKPMVNAEAQQAYYREVGRVLSDLNLRFIRSRFPELSHGEALELRRRVLDEGEVVQGMGPEDLLRQPHMDFYRRRGEPAFALVGFSGEVFEDPDLYLRHVLGHMPETYAAGRDFKGYADLLRQVHSGKLEAQEAARKTPNLSRVGGVCPCSKAVRWVDRGVTEAGLSPGAS
ncbi:MAG: phenylacetate-CoA oxygenase subunit PaaI [Deltaproteobacteria bacterium]|nr:phenylacetate-CoA oxygenase subunit PaaI [Deltaproteobacteria bacterium]